MVSNFLAAKEKTLALPQSLSVFRRHVLTRMAKRSGILTLVSLPTEIPRAAPACPLCLHLEELQGTEQLSCSPLSSVSRELQTILLLPSMRHQGGDKTACSSCPSGGTEVFSLQSLLGYRHAFWSPPPSCKAMPGKPVFPPAQITRGAAGCSSLVLLHADARRNITHSVPGPTLRQGSLTARVRLDRVGHKHCVLCCVSWVQITFKQTLMCNHARVALFCFVFFAVTLASGSYFLQPHFAARFF